MSSWSKEADLSFEALSTLMKFQGPSFWTQNGYDDENDTKYILRRLSSQQE